MSEGATGPDAGTLAAWGLGLIGGLASVAMLTVLAWRSRQVEGIRSDLADMRKDRDRFLKVMEDDSGFRQHIREALDRIEARG